ncbi:hypothetical protein WICPIJ_001918 [Wickerhamomyces pijperi]|uniref:Uncharacterized protein n=1 Tax=Wickerhamomyces pijperi TaxID=599730 RepID=A0A9P8QCQ9_WICPI|nr:hypothetical protein WICPIJ_001918 [Wickerhamomyces pijperi]
MTVPIQNDVPNNSTMFFMDTIENDISLIQGMKDILMNRQPAAVEETAVTELEAEAALEALRTTEEEELTTMVFPAGSTSVTKTTRRSSDASCWVNIIRASTLDTLVVPFVLRLTMELFEA